MASQTRFSKSQTGRPYWRTEGQKSVGLTDRGGRGRRTVAWKGHGAIGLADTRALGRSGGGMFGEPEDEEQPDLFQSELLDTTARMGEIAMHCAIAFESCRVELSKILEPHWKKIEDCGVYEERLSALRSIIFPANDSGKREATDGEESIPDAKKARSS